MRLSRIAASATVLALTFTGCATVGDPEYVAEDCSYYYPEFDSLDADGAFGEQVKLINKSGDRQRIENEQRKETISGTGAEINPDSLVTLSISAWTDQGEEILPLERWTVNEFNRFQAPWLDGILNCAQVGDRVLYTAAATSFFTPEAVGQLGLSTDEAMVIIADVIKLVPEKILGEIKEMPASFPEIENDATGAPVVKLRDSIKLPNPGEVEVFTRIESDEDAVVGENDFIAVQYHGVNLKTGEVFDTSWDTLSPLMMNLGSLIPGFQQGIVGAKVGSQIAVMVPADLGYGEYVEGQKQTGDILFLIDILASDR